MAGKSQERPEDALSHRPKTGEIISEKVDGEETASVGNLLHSMSR